MIELEWRKGVLWYRSRIPDINFAEYSDWGWSHWVIVQTNNS